MIPKTPYQIAMMSRIAAVKAIGYMKPDIDPNTRLYVPFNEGVGEVAKDYSQYGNHAQLTDVEWGIGVNGNAGVFNGTSSYGNCGNHASLNITDAITIKVWVKPKVLASWHIAAAGRYAMGVSVGIHSLNQSYTLLITTGETYEHIFSGTITGEWQHLAITYNKADSYYTLYLDCVAKGTKATDGNALANNWTKSFYIGWEMIGVNRYFNGTIDEVMILALAKSAAQNAANCYEVCN